MSIEIKVEGRKRDGRLAGRAVRYVKDESAIDENIDRLKAQVRVGNGGKWDIEVDLGDRDATRMSRVDTARCGFRDAEVGAW